MQEQEENFGVPASGRVPFEDRAVETTSTPASADLSTPDGTLYFQETRGRRQEAGGRRRGRRKEERR
ncbi:MAG: hypothetical protein F6K41_27910 [Symploca sp. SIO3E6]|nr:hypothetical protein [Caldora sp. SIO3E6]